MGGYHLDWVVDFDGWRRNWAVTSYWHKNLASTRSS